VISRLLIALIMTLAATLPSQSATKIQRVTSPGGIEAWLVSDATLPIIALNFAFRGGAAQDREGRAGIANLVSGLLDEGAGDLDAQAFQTRMEERAVEISFDADRDAFYGSLRVLTENRDEAVNLLQLALTKPRFDADAIERIRAQVLARIRHESTDPESIAHRTLLEAAFPNHPYGNEVQGTLGSVPEITRDDLTGFHARTFARDNLVVVAVGAIDAETLGATLDKAFGALPAKAELQPVPATTLAGAGTLKVLEVDTPQTAIAFARSGPLRNDKDFMAYFVLNHILGGGTFTSRLFEEVREKRGLSYGVNTWLAPMKQAGLFGGSLATRNDRASEALQVIRDEIAKLAKEPPSDEELAKAKKYLVGSYPLRFDASAKIANGLLQIQLDGLGIDYIDKRNAMIEAVTREDLKRVATELLGDGNLLVVAVGKPEGLGNAEGQPKDAAPAGAAPAKQPVPAEAGKASTR
jgi:zinc protease